MNVKIIGAGSIGNHLAQASRRIGWNVVVVDRDPAALERMKTDIYPTRYGSWDEAIKLFESGQEPTGGFDIIMLGTPPDVRMILALAAIDEKPKILHLEKPLCTPLLEHIPEFMEKMKRNSETIVTVGYDHGVAASVEYIVDLLTKKTVGDILTIDVEFRAHWRDIFNAHPWLNGPADTYLGFWQRGGGAGGEHSHALHLWQNFAFHAGWGDIKEIKSMVDIQSRDGAEYDQFAGFLLKTNHNHYGRVIQDVITIPTKKWARIQGTDGFIEWLCESTPQGDVVRYQINDQDPVEKVFAKKRPDDFYRLVEHYQQLIDGQIKPKDSPLYFDTGLKVMKILNQAYPVK